MAQPFQFDIYGAPPADPSAGFAAYSQGMSNAANLIAQSGSQFSALRQVAQDYQRFNQEKELQKRSLDAEAAYRNARLRLDKEQGDQLFGVQKSRAETERMNAELRARGLDYEYERDKLARTREERLAQQAVEDAAREAQMLAFRRMVEDRYRLEAMRGAGLTNDQMLAGAAPGQGANVASLLGIPVQTGVSGGAQGIPNMAPVGDQPMPGPPPMTRHPADRGQAPQAPRGQGQPSPQGGQQGQMSPEQQRGLAEGLQRAVLRRVKAGELAPEQAEDELMRLLRAAGIQ